MSGPNSKRTDVAPESCTSAGEVQARFDGHPDSSTTRRLTCRDASTGRSLSEVGTPAQVWPAELARPGWGRRTAGSPLTPALSRWERGNAGPRWTRPVVLARW